MNRSNQQKQIIREKKRGIGFETAADMGGGGGYRRNTSPEVEIATHVDGTPI